MTTITMPLHHLERFTERARALATRAQKLNIPGYTVTWTVGEPWLESVPTEYGFPRLVRLVNVSVDYPGTLRIGNHIPLYKMEHGSGETRSYHFPGAPELSPESIAPYLANSSCEHCNTNRRRKYLYLLQDLSTGSLLQVGKSCLRDFLGHDIPDSFGPWFQELQDLITDDYSASPELLELPTSDVAHICTGVIRAYGYLSKSAAMERGGTSTSTLVWSFVFGGKDSEQLRANVRAAAVPEPPAQLLSTVRIFCDTNIPRHSSEFARNLHIALYSDTITHRDISLIAYAVHRYLGHITLKPTATYPQEHLAPVGTKLSVPLTFVSCETRTSRYGDAFYLYTFTSETGALVKWMTQVNHELSPGAVYNVSCRVKSCDIYKDTYSTVITNPRFKPL